MTPAPETPAVPVAPARRQAALAFIFVTILLDMMSMGMISPVLPRLVVEFSGGDMVHSAEIYGLFGTVWALMQFLSMPVLGALSDRVGRRPVILVSNFGLGLDFVLMALAPSLAWLFVGRVVSGITAASITTAFAYVADVTPAEKRAGAFGMMGAAFGIGFIVGPAMGGVLGEIDPRLPFWAAAALSLLNAMYGYFILPESLRAEHRSPFDWRKANPVGALALLRSQPRLLGLASVHFLYQFAHVVLPAVFVLYTTHRYGWSEGTVGLTLAFVGVCAIVVQAGLVRPFVRRFGERVALISGLTAGAAAFAIFGLAETQNAFWVGIPVLALWGFASAAVQSLATQRVGPSAQGQLQGALSGLQGVAGLIGPGIFTLTFAFFIAPERSWQAAGAPFLLAALLLVGALIVGARATAPAEAATGERSSQDS